jgi:hypothetical protein
LAKRSRFSRFRRLPGIYRFGDQKPPDPGLEPVRLTLYLPGSSLDRAEAQARRAGISTVQEYCKQLLQKAIDGEHSREVVEEAARRGPLEGFDAVSNDPTYLAEWKASAASHDRGPRSATEAHEMNAPSPDPASSPKPETASNSRVEWSESAAIVLRHAALLGDDPAGFLSTLRRGEPIDSVAAQELIRALCDLEVELRDATRLDRKLAYALHRLAFEGQVLLTDAWPGTTAEEATIDVLRIVQEAVDRVLSGEDIRYFAPEPGPERLL